jgi:hypothetical protein
MGDTRKDGDPDMQKSAAVLKAEVDEKVALGYTNQVRISLSYLMAASSA